MNSAKFQDAKSTCKNQLHFCTLTTKGISKTSPFIIASKGWNSEINQGSKSAMKATKSITEDK